MITISQVSSWQPETMIEYGNSVIVANDTFAQHIADFGRRGDDLTTHWRGDGGSAASIRAITDRLSASHVESAVTAIAEVYSSFGKQLSQTKEALASVVDDAVAGAAMSVTDDGYVHAPEVSGGNTVAVAILQGTLNGKAAWFQRRIQELLIRASDDDGRAASAIREAVAELDLLRRDPNGGRLSQQVSDIVRGVTQLSGEPGVVHELWENLSPAEKDALFDWDHSIGNRDGIPQIDRDHYNRAHLQELRDAARQRLDLLMSAHGAVSDEKSWSKQIDTIRAEIAGYDNVNAQLSAGSEQPRLLSLIDGNGHAVIALENPDVADTVSTFVPGTGANLGDVATGVSRAEAMRDAAVAADPYKVHSVVAWYGYDAPQSVTSDATKSVFAEDAAPKLDRFQEGLRTTHEGQPSLNTMIGHSYGTTVIGHAASGEHTLDADRVVLVGSPGIGVDKASELNLTGVSPQEASDHVYSTTAKNDPIRLTPNFIHGPQPVSHYGWGHSFDSDGVSGPWYTLGWNVDSHGGYWDPGNAGLKTMGQIIAGVEVGDE